MKESLQTDNCSQSPLYLSEGHFPGVDRAFQMECNILLTLTVLGLLKKATADCAKNNTYNDDIKLNAQEGQLSNPGYPEYFTDNIQCTWLIRVARRHSIELEFEFFDVRPQLSCSERPQTSYIEIHDGIDRDSRSLGVFCGRKKPEKTASSDNEMSVRFKTNGYRSTKFKANYRAIKDSPSALLVVAGVSTIVGLMVILLLLTLYLKRKRRYSDEENTSLAGPQNQDNQPNCASAARAASGKPEQNTGLQFYTVEDTRKQSVRHEDNNTLLPGFRSEEKQPNCACVTSGTLPQNPHHQVSLVKENTEMHEQSMFEKHQVNYCPMSERKRSQSLGAFAKSNLAPVVE